MDQQPQQGSAVGHGATMACPTSEFVKTPRHLQRPDRDYPIVRTSIVTDRYLVVANLLDERDYFAHECAIPGVALSGLGKGARVYVDGRYVGKLIETTASPTMGGRVEFYVYVEPIEQRA